MLKAVILGCMVLTTGLTHGSTALGDFENGDFTLGKSHWKGLGEVVLLKEDGTTDPAPIANDDPSPASLILPPGTTRAMELKLVTTGWVRFSQTFARETSNGRIAVTVTFRASADFKIPVLGPADPPKEIAPHLRDLKTSIVAELMMNISQKAPTSGQSTCSWQKIEPDAGWQSLTVHFTNATDVDPITIDILTPPGSGSIFIKAVVVANEPNPAR